MTRKTPTTEMRGSGPTGRGSERNLRERREVGASNVAVWRDETDPSETEHLMERVVERDNMAAALRRVEQNKGAAGVDRMSTEALRRHLHTHWPTIKAKLLEGRYIPSPVKRVDIPKPGGGMRKLGIPTVMDRLIQQAMHQVMSPIFERTFSDSSYGFRPGRSAHDAIKAAREHVRSGKRWVVDIDLEKFFDRVNHDILMARVERKIRDQRVLRLIRRYLRAGVMEGGLTEAAREGTPQGGPVSPLLSNIILDDLDKELERRGHAFCRYADDSNIYVRTEKAGERVMASLIEFLERKLKLKVNREKSAVGRPWLQRYLGYSMTMHKEPRLKPAREAVKRLKSNLKDAFRQGRGRNIKRFIEEELNPKLRGWNNYFKPAEVKIVFEELDAWMRRRLRAMHWKQWKRPRTRYKRLVALGLDPERAQVSSWSGRGAWWNAGASHLNQALPKAYFDRLGLVAIVDERRRWKPQTI